MELIATRLDGAAAPLIGWDITALAYLARTWATVGRLDPDATRAHAQPTGAAAFNAGDAAAHAAAPQVKSAGQLLDIRA